MESYTLSQSCLLVRESTLSIPHSMVKSSLGKMSKDIHLNSLAMHKVVVPAPVIRVTVESSEISNSVHFVVGPLSIVCGSVLPCALALSNPHSIRIKTTLIESLIVENYLLTFRNSLNCIWVKFFSRIRVSVRVISFLIQFRIFFILSIL